MAKKIGVDMKNFIYFPTVEKVEKRKYSLHIIWTNEKETWIPKRMILNESLLWLIGLWMGDRTSAYRTFGIANTETSIIKSTISIIGQLIPRDKIKISIRLSNKKPYLNPKNIIKKYARIFKLPLVNIRIDSLLTDSYTPLFVVDAGTNLLSKAFLWIENNIDKLFKRLPRKLKCAWVAGYFDAEGSVDMMANNLWFSTANKDRSIWLKGILKNLGFSAKSSKRKRIKNVKKEFLVIIGYRNEIREKDFQLFYRYIFPFMKHKRKRDEVKKLIRGYRVREIDVHKYLLGIFKSFKKNWFTRFEFEKRFRLKSRSGSTILKNLSDAKLLYRREYPGWQKAGQIPYLYKISKLGLRLTREIK